MASVRNTSQALQSRLQSLYKDGRIGVSELDNQAIQDLYNAPEDVAMRSLDIYLESSRKKALPNDNSEFMRSLLKKSQVSKLNRKQRAHKALPQEVQIMLESLYVSGKLRPDELEAQILDSLAQFDSQQGCSIIQAFSQKDMTTVKNKSGFLAGIMKRFRSGLQQEKSKTTYSESPQPLIRNQLTLPPSAPNFISHVDVQPHPNIIFPSSSSLISSSSSYGYPSTLYSISNSLDSLHKPEWGPLPNSYSTQSLNSQTHDRNSDKLNSQPQYLINHLPPSPIHINCNNNNTSVSNHNSTSPPWIGNLRVLPQQSLYITPPPPQMHHNTLSDSQPQSPSLSPTSLPLSVQEKLDRFYTSRLIAPGEIDQRILDSLAQFPASTGEAILDKLGEVDLTTVHNKNGFLAGIMRRFRGAVPCDPQQNILAQSVLPMSVQRTLETIYATGLVRREEIDARCLTQLADLDEVTAVDCLQRFQMANLTMVNNKSGFLVGIVKRTKQEKGIPCPSTTSPASPHQCTLLSRPYVNNTIGTHYTQFSSNILH